MSANRSLESISVIIWVYLTCTWDERPVIVKTNFLSTVTIIKNLVRGLLIQHDSIRGLFMRDEFDIKWIKFVYQTPYLVLVISEIITWNFSPSLMTNRESPNTSILWPLNQLVSKSLNWGLVLGIIISTFKFLVACDHHSIAMQINEEISSIYSLCIPRNIKV